jgi:hypothetical protein
MNRPTLVVFWALAVCAGLLASCRTSEQPVPKQADQAPAAQPSTPPEGQPSQPADQPAQQPASQPEKSAEPAAPPSAKGGDQLVPLNIKLPKPMFVGTPTNISVPNLEKPLGHPRPPFLAPAGTANVALKKPVSSSDEAPIIGELAMVVDGDKEGGEGSFVELGPGVQYVTIDLKAPHTIYAVLVWHYHKQPVVYHDVIVQVSNDRDFVSNVSTVFNNDIDNTSGKGAGKDMSYVETSEGKLIDARGVQGRYVRLSSRGNTSNDLNHYIEVEVFGKAAQ